MKRILQVGWLLPLCIFLASPARVFANDWYRWRGPDLNGISTETGWQSQWPDDGPKRLWKASVGIGFSSMTVSKGRLYTMGNSGTSKVDNLWHDPSGGKPETDTSSADTVWCFDAATGAVIWKHSYASPLDPKFYEGGTSSTPTVDGDRVYSVSKKGNLFCLDAATGKVIWSKDLPQELGCEIPTWGFAGSALVQGDLLVMNIGSAGLGLDKKTGAVVWHSGTGASGYATPVPFQSGDRHSIILAASETIECVDVADGKSIWTYPWKTQYDLNAADPVVSGDKVFVSSGYQHGSAMLDIKRDKPSFVWANKEFRNHINSSVLWKGYLYGVDDFSNTQYALRCVAWDTGEIKWTETKFGKGSLIIADGKIIGLSDKGELYVIDPTPDGFKPISHAQVLGGKCWTTPVLANGRIYCRNSKGDLVCLDVSGKP